MKINAVGENLYRIAHDIPTLAETYRLEGDASTAARLLGAADALLEGIDAALEGMEKDMYDRSVASLRTALGEEKFEAARLEGRMLAWTDVTEMA